MGNQIYNNDLLYTLQGSFAVIKAVRIIENLVHHDFSTIFLVLVDSIFIFTSYKYHWNNWQHWYHHHMRSIIIIKYYCTWNIKYWLMIIVVSHSYGFCVIED